MNLPLLRLSARRAAPLPALAAVAGVTLLAVVDQPGRAEIVEVSPTFEDVIRRGQDLAASTGWLAGVLVASVLVALFAARVPDRWFRDEGDWLGVTGTSRSSIVRTCLAGILTGAAGFSVVIGLVAGALGGGPDAPLGDHATPAPLLELASIAGPSRSLLLMPGERFEQELPDGAIGPDTRVRIRVAPALGAEGATTSAPDRVGRPGIRAAGRAAHLARGEPLPERRRGVRHQHRQRRARSDGPPGRSRRGASPARPAAGTCASRATFACTWSSSQPSPSDWAPGWAPASPPPWRSRCGWRLAWHSRPSRWRGSFLEERPWRRPSTPSPRGGAHGPSARP